MPARPISIRRRILVGATALLLVAALALVVFLHAYAERSSDRAFDRLLAASALTIAGAVQLEDGVVTVELPLASFAMFSGEDRIFYSVLAPSGAEVTGDPDLGAALPRAGDDDAVFADDRYGGEAVRIATVGRLVSSAAGTGWVTIRVAETQGERDALSREILGNALLPVAAMTLLSLALLGFGIGRVFAPLAGLERHLRARAPENLEPVEAPAPIEVAQLVGALNGFMARLRTARERLEALVAEAAHEVRTPLASLRAQAEVARGEPDAAELRRQVARIHDGAVQASQLVSQLLMDATISHRLETPNAAGPTELAMVLGEVVGRLDPDLASRVGVHVDPAAAEARLAGDRVVLREMLRNLLDNALRYSAGPVSVFVAPARAPAGAPGPRAVEIHVSDRGPGIPEAEKALVFERFRRGAAAEGRTGSGLGLAIVRRVVAAEGGDIALKDRSGGGLTVCVTLPLAAGRGAGRRAGAAPAGLLALAAAALALALLAPPHAAAAAETLYPAPDGSAADLLRVSGTTDTPLFTPLVRAFQATRPGVGVAYEEGDTRPIFERFLAGEGASPDILMSSASDLQVKLVNGGFARTYDSPAVRALPAWARWRSQVFGFSFEPAVIVYNRQALREADVPRTHLGFAELLERDPDRLRGRVATYDVASSGVGYLLATQDAAISSYFWRLASAFGRADAAVSGSSPAILDGLADGRLAIGYNVLGSYAFARQQAGAPIGIVVPDDYVLVLTRSMLIPARASRPDLAEAFVEFTLSPAGQAVLAGPAALGSVVPGSPGRWTAERIASLGHGAVQPIALGPSLLVGLDRQRRARFLETWREIVSPR